MWRSNNFAASTLKIAAAPCQRNVNGHQSFIVVSSSYYAFHLCCFFARVHLWPRLFLGIAPCDLPSARAGLVAAQANIFLKPVFFGFLRLPFEFLPKRSSQGRTIFSSCRNVSGYGLLSCRCIATAKLLVVAEKKKIFFILFSGTRSYVSAPSAKLDFGSKG